MAGRYIWIMRFSSLCLAGPTASGKSRLALWLARKIKGDIINADSLQLYEDLPLLTARPQGDELALCPHHLYGFLNPNRPFCVGAWLEKVEALLPSLSRPPVFVGGTGLYFKSLLEGLAPIPQVTPQVRVQVRALFEEGGLKLLIKEAKTHAPHLGPLPLDPQRLTRVLEVYLSSGKPLSFWQAQTKTPLLNPQNTLCVILMPPKNFLHARALERLTQAFPTCLNEMTLLLEKYPDLEKAPLMQALGAKELLHVCRGTLSKDEGLERAFIRTRQYIKRQRTWFTHQMPYAHLIEEEDFSAQQRLLETLLEKNFS
jgi:tRNA dimethylallyltransferase